MTALWGLALALGVALASVAAARTPLHLPLFGAGCLLLVACVGWGRNRAQKLRRAAAGDLGASDSLDRSRGGALAEVSSAIRALRAEAESIELPAMLARLDAVIEGPIQSFVALTEAWQPIVAPEVFARSAGPFATAERFVARAWSATADGHRGEATASLDAALAHLEDVDRALGLPG